jgi:hypothetical protein
VRVERAGCFGALSIRTDVLGPRMRARFCRTVAESQAIAKLPGARLGASALVSCRACARRVIPSRRRRHWVRVISPVS